MMFPRYSAMPREEEDALVARAQGGDSEAVSALYRRYWRLTVAAAKRELCRLRVYPAAPFAEDAAQNLWARLNWRCASAPIRPFLFAAAKRSAVDVVRALRGRAFNRSFTGIPVEDESLCVARHFAVGARTAAQDARLELALIFGGCGLGLGPRDISVLAGDLAGDTLRESGARLGVCESRAHQLYHRVVKRARAEVAV